MAVILSIFLTLILEEFMTIVFAIMLVAFALLYYSGRHTVAAAGQAEINTRLRLFQHVHNETINRAAVQSVDGVLQSRNRIFTLIEENSATVYLQKSLVFFAQSLFELTSSFGLALVFLVMHFDPHRSDYTYVVLLYIFSMLAQHLYALLDLRFTKTVADLKVMQDRKFAATNDGGLAASGAVAANK